MNEQGMVRKRHCCAARVLRTCEINRSQCIDVFSRGSAQNVRSVASGATSFPRAVRRRLRHDRAVRAWVIRWLGGSLGVVNGIVRETA